ncbi:MAG: SpoIID/LytB domain-containing protein [Terriglobales bacterium]
MLRRVLGPIFIAALCAVSLVGQNATDTLRFGVFSLFKPKYLVVRPAKNQVLLLTISKSSVPIDDEIVIRAAGEVLLVTAAGKSTHADSLLISSRNGDAADFMLKIPGKISREFRGTLSIAASHHQLVPVVEVGRELAVAIAVKAEAPPHAAMEALKAQAVVARSFYLGSKERHQAFDFCDTTHCQLFKALPAANEPAFRAAQETRGLVLHYQGAIVPAMFSANCGGRTRTLKQVGINSDAYPYYSVEDAYCERHAKHWQAHLSSPEAKALAGSRSEHDRLVLGRKVGWNVVPGNNYEVKRESDALVFEGRGSGHGLGLCQQGASAMAGDGASFREILAHYFPNTTVGE